MRFRWCGSMFPLPFSVLPSTFDSYEPLSLDLSVSCWYGLSVILRKGWFVRWTPHAAGVAITVGLLD